LDREQARDYIKDQLEGYLKARGINTARPFNCLNPDHTDKKPSMSYDSKRKKAHCFSCNADYDTFDLIGIEHGLTQAGDIFNKAHQIYGVNIDTERAREQQLRKPGDSVSQKPIEPIDQTAYIEQAHSRVKETDYFNKRGISQATIDRFKLGYDPSFKTRAKGGYVTWEAVIIPSSPYSYTVRNIDPEADPTDRIRKRGSSSLYNREALQSGKPVFIVEGELDALSLIEVGAEATALASTANADQLIKYLKSNPPKGGLILSLDNDQAGIDTTAKLAQELEGMGISFLQANIAGGYKDPNEALIKDWDAFTQAVQDAQDMFDAQNRVEMEAEREEYQKNSTAHYIDAFINGIADSVNTPAIPTGFDKLDRLLDDGLYEGLYVLGGISSLGKTTFIMQIADQIAQAGHDVLIFSLEMARTELMAKSISRLTLLTLMNSGGDTSKPDTSKAKTTRGITAGKRWSGYSQAERDLIQDSIQAYSEYAHHVYIIEGMGDIGANEIRAAVAKHSYLTGKPPVVFIDYLQLLAPHNDRASDKQTTDWNVMELKRISRDYKTPVIAVSSFNRQSYKDQANMSSFKESGVIEYSSDVLIGLQAEGAGGANFDINKAKDRKVRQVEVMILKQRNGPTGKGILFDYHPLFNAFIENGEVKEIR